MAFTDDIQIERQSGRPFRPEMYDLGGKTAPIRPVFIPTQTRCKQTRVEPQGACKWATHTHTVISKKGGVLSLRCVCLVSRVSV